MRTSHSLAAVFIAAGALAAAAAAAPDGSGPATGPTVAAIADASPSWAAFSAKVPDLPEALAAESRLAAP